MFGGALVAGRECRAAATLAAFGEGGLGEEGCVVFGGVVGGEVGGDEEVGGVAGEGVGGVWWLLGMSVSLFLGGYIEGVDERFFGLLLVVENVLVGTMVSMRASSLWNRLLFFTSSFENSRAP